MQDCARLSRKRGAKSGIITLIQRFGSALNLNIHLHMIVLDGVYTFDDAGGSCFHPVDPPDLEVMQRLLDRDGFSLNASVACQPHQRARLERLCRYVTRPALALDRLSTNAKGEVETLPRSSPL